MYEEEEVEKAGEKAVVDMLKDMGCTDVDIISMEKRREIRAKKENEQILVKVKSSIYPLDPGFLSEEELENLQEEASSLGAKARIARLWLNEDLTPKYRNANWKRI